MDFYTIYMDKNAFMVYNMIKESEFTMNIYNGNLHDLYNIESKSYIQINSCGISNPTTTDSLTIRKKGRTDYHILYITEGETEVFYDTQSYSLKKGGFALYPSGMPQKYRMYKNSKNFWIHFNGFQIKEILNEAGLKACAYNAEYSVQAENIFVQLITEHSIAREKYISTEKGLLITLLYTLGKLAVKKENTLTDKRILDCMSYINTHYNIEITNDMLASMCSLSKSRFLHLFKSESRLTPHAYQQQLRIENSKALLLSTTLNISEISELSGYSDPLYFSRVFKKHIGISPQAYREKAK